MSLREGIVSLTAIIAFIRLARPLNGLIAAISVILGAFLAGGIQPLCNVLIVAAAAFLLLSAGNTLNDVCDVNADAINKPARPIPSGKVKAKHALAFAIVLFIIGTALGLFVSWMAFSVAIAVSILLVVYTVALRRFVLVSNLAIGILTGLTFISGGIAVGAIGNGIIPAVFACLFTTGREIVKDIQDIEGDKSTGLSSLPAKIGRKRATYVAVGFMSLVVFLSPLPYLLHIYSLYYLIAVVAGVDIVLGWCILILLKKPTERSARRVSSLMKLDIFIGLGAIYLGSIY